MSLNGDVCRCGGFEVDEGASPEEATLRVCSRRGQCSRFLEKDRAGSGGMARALCGWDVDRRAFRDFFLQGLEEIGDA